MSSNDRLVIGYMKKLFAENAEEGGRDCNSRVVAITGASSKFGLSTKECATLFDTHLKQEKQK